jgi:hypothetical protein
MNCPMCQKVIPTEHCYDCRLTYWTAKEISEFCDENPTDELREFAKKHPGEPSYWFGMTGKYYTLMEMERMARLKAFL